MEKFCIFEKQKKKLSQWNKKKQAKVASVSKELSQRDCLDCPRLLWWTLFVFTSMGSSLSQAQWSNGETSPTEAAPKQTPCHKSSPPEHPAAPRAAAPELGTAPPPEKIRNCGTALLFSQASPHTSITKRGGGMLGLRTWGSQKCDRRQNDQNHNKTYQIKKQYLLIIFKKCNI